MLMLVLLFATIAFISSGSDSALALAKITLLLGCVVLPLAMTAFHLWNLVYRRGTTGQSLGQQVVKIKTVGERTGQPLGCGRAFLLYLCRVLDALVCYLGYLAPLWDSKRQTWADKIVRTVVVRVDSQPGGRSTPTTPGSSNMTGRTDPFRRVVSLLRRMPETTRLVATLVPLGAVLATGIIPLPCPFRLLTGLDCPFCGGSRMLGALLQGDFARALDLNAFAMLVVLPVAVAFVLAGAARELGHLQRQWPAGRLGRVLSTALVCSIVLWGIVRNIPVEPFTVLRA